MKAIGASLQLYMKKIIVISYVKNLKRALGRRVVTMTSPLTYPMSDMSVLEKYRNSGPDLPCFQCGAIDSV